MKINMFDTDSKKRHGGSGLAVGIFEDQEDLLINEIDKADWSSEKILANEFLAFLGNRRLTLTKLKELPIEEQERLRIEFMGD